MIVGDRCTACGACLPTCPEQALLPAPRRPVVDAAACTDCLACVEVCPVDALSTVAPPHASPVRPGASR